MGIIDLFPTFNFELFWGMDLSGSIFDCAHQKSLSLTPKLWIKVDKINRKKSILKFGNKPQIIGDHLTVLWLNNKGMLGT